MGDIGMRWSVELHADYIHDFRKALVEPTFDREKQGFLVLLGFLRIESHAAWFEPLSLVTAESLFLRQIGV